MLWHQLWACWQTKPHFRGTGNLWARELSHKVREHQKMSWPWVLCPLSIARRTETSSTLPVVPFIDKHLYQKPFPKGTTAKTKTTIIYSPLDSLDINGCARSPEWSWVRRGEDSLTHRVCSQTFNLKPREMILVYSKQALRKQIYSPGKTGLWCNKLTLAKWENMCIL